MHRYHLYGFRVASDLDLSLPEAGIEEGPAEVTLQRTQRPVDDYWEPDSEEVLIRHREPDRDIGYVAGRTADGLRFRIDTVCQFDLSPDLSQVSWRVAVGVELSRVAILAAGALMAFRMGMAGHLVMHSSAVLAHGQGLAFVGASGMGKSTMATILCAGGAQIITDDVARIEFVGPTPAVWPGGGEARLRPAAASLTDLFDGNASSRMTSDGRTALLLPRITGDPVPVKAVVIPLPNKQHDKIVAQKLKPTQALVAIGCFPRLLGWVDGAVQKQQFELLADLVERIPVYQACIPWGPPFDATTGTQLLDELGWSVGTANDSD